MKTKTKEVLAGIGWGLAVTGGLAGAGVGIYAIATMRHPYINQWADLASKEERFDPIVSQVDKDYIKKTMGVETLTENTVIDFYHQKLSVTPEIFVEDFLFATTREMDNFAQEKHYKFTRNRVRVSDVAFEIDDNKMARLSFRWNQDLIYTNGSGEESTAIWSVKFDDLPMKLRYINNIWTISFDLDDTSWKAYYVISEAKGELNKQAQIPDVQEVDCYTIKNYITMDYFRNFDFDDSYYLAKIKPSPPSQK